MDIVNKEVVWIDKDKVRTDIKTMTYQESKVAEKYMMRVQDIYMRIVQQR